MKRLVIQFFTRSDSKCSLCERAMARLKTLQKQYPFDIEKVDIVAKGNDSFYEMYQFDIPVMVAKDSGKELCRHYVHETNIKKYFEEKEVKPIHIETLKSEEQSN